MPLAENGREVPVLVRSLSLGARPRPLVMRLAAAPAAAAIVGPDAVARIESRDGHLDLVIPAGEEPLDLAVAIAAADASKLAVHAASISSPPGPYLYC